MYEAEFSTLNKVGTKNGVDLPQRALRSRSVKTRTAGHWLSRPVLRLRIH